MARGATANANSGRALALARRKAMSSGGKTAVAGSNAPSASRPQAAAPAVPSQTVTARAPVSSRVAGDNGRAASKARRRAMSTRGKVAIKSEDRVRSAPVPRVAERPAKAANKAEVHDCGCGCGGKKADDAPASPATGTNSRKRLRQQRRAPIAKSSGKAAALARRKAMSTRGKAGLGSGGLSEAQTARAANPELSGRQLAQALRDQRSRRGGAGKKAAPKSGRVRRSKNIAVGAAKDAPWKVGASETSQGQTVTGTMVGRDKTVTGNEPSTCRAVTGTEYMGAEIFSEFCQTDAPKSPQRGGTSATARGNAVTGNKVGRSERVTGDEPGTCQRVTGSEYVGASQSEAFCGTKSEPSPMRMTTAQTHKDKTVTGDNVGRSENVTGGEAGADRQLTGTQYMQLGESGAPAKVATSSTLRGGSVTGTLVGRSGKVTGDEPGSCRNVTGDDYVSQEQYGEFCGTKPEPADQKVGISKTLAGETVTGTMTGKSTQVTGNEPGTCKAVTGTPYAGSEQYATFCEPAEVSEASARMLPMARQFGAKLTGQQPGVGGTATGDRRGACEPVSGTPYVGSDQVVEACPASAAEPGSPDFPQPIEGAPWDDFSVTPPTHAAQVPSRQSAVTGAQSDNGNITGPFGMADGKVTGTEHQRFDRAPANAPRLPMTAGEVDGRVKSRISGEGMDAGAKITGDDWDRGDRVTGTEGKSSSGRNPTRRGDSMAAMNVRPAQPKTDVPEPVSKVTGGSGNTDKGSLITYSGGARG